MPRGSKGKYSSKQKRIAEHIEKGYEKKGMSAGRAKAKCSKSPCHSPGCQSLFVRRPLFERQKTDARKRLS
jgi:hypothetical protein